MFTASHNPATDNGYKVYLGTGAQIVPPADTDIAASIDLVDACAVALSPVDHPLIHHLGQQQVQAYLAAVPGVRLRPDAKGVQVAYTALHGVGGATLLAAFERAGLPAPAFVVEQQTPDVAADDRGCRDPTGEREEPAPASPSAEGTRSQECARTHRRSRGWTPSVRSDLHRRQSFGLRH